MLSETNKTKFFSKYRAISQELEKCLDDLLLVSATISSLDDQDDDDDDDEQDDDKEDNKVDEACSNKQHVEKKKGIIITLVSVPRIGNTLLSTLTSEIT